MRLFILMVAVFFKIFTCGSLFLLVLLLFFENSEPVQSKMRSRKRLISSSQRLLKFARVLTVSKVLSARASPHAFDSGGKLLFDREFSTHSPPTEKRSS